MTTALERATTKLVEVTRRITVATTNRDKAVKMLITQEALLKRLARERMRLVRHGEKLAKGIVEAREPKSTPEPQPDTGIPAFLQRDKAIAAEIKAEVADRKKRKARGRVAKMLAKKAGETTRMPLAGREAERYLKTL
jgi:hypothetical protein